MQRYFRILYLAPIFNFLATGTPNGLSALYLSVSSDAISEVLKSFLIRPYEFLKLLLFWYFGEKITQSEIDEFYLDPNMSPETAQNLHTVRVSMRKITHLQDKLDKILGEIEKLKETIMREKLPEKKVTILQRMRNSMSSNHHSTLLHLHREASLLEAKIHAFKLCVRSAQHYLENGGQSMETLNSAPLPKIASKEELNNLIMHKAKDKSKVKSDAEDAFYNRTTYPNNSLENKEKKSAEKTDTIPKCLLNKDPSSE